MRADDDNGRISSSPVAPEPRTWEVRMDPDTGPAAIPASVVGEVPSPEISPSGATSYDLVSKEIVTLEEAQSLFDVYAYRLDHYLYRILGDSPSLERIRSSSSLLLAAVCTVGSLHSPNLGSLFDRCYRKFIDLAAARTFAKDNNLDDVRALCIGAFWLHEVSWTLIGQGLLVSLHQGYNDIDVRSAVRISAQLQLHRSIYKALNGDKESYYQTRLYYLVYVCNHHFSIPYGRPSMARTDESILAAQRVLKSKHAVEDDARLISQVKLWSIATYVLDDFGFDVDRPVSQDLIPNIRRFSIALDTWRADWSESFGLNPHVGDYPRKGVGLHYHFAKLYLCAHAFRGAPVSSHSAYQLTPELEEVAQAALQSAKAILRTIIMDEEMQSHLNGLPLYFDTMIAFAVVFLLKVATKFAATVRSDSNAILLIVGDMAHVLKKCTAHMHSQHLLVCIADGIAALLQKCKEAGHLEHRQLSVTENLNHHQNIIVDHTDPISGGFDWTNYDFLLSSQDAMPGFDTWPMNVDLSTS